MRRQPSWHENLKRLMLKRRVRWRQEKKLLFCIYKKQSTINTTKWISVPRWVHPPVSLRRWGVNVFGSRNTHSSILNTNQFSWIDQVCFDQSNGWLFSEFCILFSALHQWFWCQWGIFLDNWQQPGHVSLKAAFDFCMHASMFFKMSSYYQHVVVRAPLSESPSHLQSST